jgi:hypothetical protein
MQVFEAKLANLWQIILARQVEFLSAEMANNGKF